MNFPVPRVLVCAMQGFSERDMKFGALEEVGNSSFYAIYIHVEGAVPNVIIVTLRRLWVWLWCIVNSINMTYLISSRQQV